MRKKRAKITNPVNPVKEKARIGGTYAIDFATLRKAEEAIIAMTPQFLDWVKTDLENIEKFINKLKAPDNQARETLKEIFRIAHDMKGQGGTFGFNLITTIADQLCQMIDKFDTIGEEELEAIQVHIDAIKLVVKDNMLGNGGEEGAKILTGLKKVSNKILG